MDHIITPPVHEESPAVSASRFADASSPFAISRRVSWLVLGLIALLYVGTCFTPVIFDDNEGLYADAAREMHQAHNWLVPLSNGFPRVQKPPLVYWTMLVSTSLLGWNEFALRLPNALATVGWIVATYLLARRTGGERLGLASALILASMLGVWVFTHLIQPEPFLACFITLSFWCLIEARTARLGTGDFWYVCFWIFLALGTMSKGLHGALWPLATVALTAIFIPGWRPWLRPVLHARGFLLFLAIALPWYIYMAAHFRGFLYAHFMNEQLGATFNTRFPADARQLPITQFYLQHLIFWLPWTLLFPAAIHALIRAGKISGADLFFTPARDMARLLAIWVGLVMFSVAFSTRQDYYSMSCWGAVAIFLALPWIDRAPFSRISRWYLFVPCLLIAAIGIFSLGFTDWMRLHLASFGAATASPIQSRDTFMDALAGISPALWGQFIVLLGIFGLAALLAGAAASVLAWNRRFFSALLVLAGAMAVPVCLATVGFAIMSPYFSLAQQARAINAEIATEPHAVVACEALPNTASSLLYYLHARVHWVNAPFDNQYAQQILGLGRDYYWDEGQLQQTWGSSVPVYFIIEEDRLAHWRPLLPGARLVKKSGTRLVLCNH